MKKYIWLLLLLFLPGCGTDAIDYVKTTVILPPQEDIYPSDDKIKVLEEAFSVETMEWTASELSEIRMHRNAIKGIFWFLDKRQSLSDVPLYTAKDSMEQGLAHYSALKDVLSTRRIKLPMMQGIIYDDTVRDSDRVLKAIRDYLNSMEQSLTDQATQFDFKYLETAWGYISPLVGSLK